MPIKITKIHNLVASNNNNNNNAASTPKENLMTAVINGVTVTGTFEQIQQLLASQPVAQPVAQRQQSMEEAIKSSVSSRLLNWTGSTIKTAAEKTAPVIGKVEVMAVPATLTAVGYVSSKTGNVAEAFSHKLQQFGKASTAAAARHTPGANTNSVIDQLNNLSKEELIALLAAAAAK